MKRRDDHALWMLVVGVIVLFASVIGFTAFLTYPYRQAGNPPATKPVEPAVTPPAVARPVETTPDTKPAKSTPVRHRHRPAAARSAAVAAERPPPPDCAGQTGHNFGPCPGYVHPYLSLQSPGDSSGASSTSAAAAASSGHGGGHGGHGGGHR